MTDRELLELLVKSVNNINIRLDRMEADIAELKKDVAELKKDVAELKENVAILNGDVAELKGDVAELKGDVAELKENVAVLNGEVAELKGTSAKHGGAIAELQLAVSRLEAAQLRTSATLESTVDKCVQVLYETHTLNAERLDKFDIEAIKNNSEIAATLAKTTYDTIMNRLKAV